jgi:hypothetical protein
MVKPQKKRRKAGLRFNPVFCGLALDFFNFKPSWRMGYFHKPYFLANLPDSLVLDKKYRLPFLHKVAMAFGSMAIFYPILLFINSKPEHWANYHSENLSLFLVEYVCGSLMTLLWVLLADAMQRLLSHWFGEESLGFSKPGLNLGFLLVFLASGILLSGIGTHGVRYVTENIFRLGNHIFYESPDYVAHGMRAGIGLFTLQALVLYVLILNRNILIRNQNLLWRSELLEK